MAEKVEQVYEDSRTPINLVAEGKKVRVVSKGERMRLLICPHCDQHYLKEDNKSIYTKCPCGCTIRMKDRWFD